MIRTRHIGTLEVTIGVVHHIGAVPGGTRRVIEITGGTMSGPILNGEVLPGGADWNTERPDGNADVWARYTLRTSDGVALGITNSGTVHVRDGEVEAVTSIRLEAPEGSYAWLNDAVIVGTLRPIEDREAVEIGLYEATFADADA